MFGPHFWWHVYYTATGFLNRKVATLKKSELGIQKVNMKQGYTVQNTKVAYKTKEN